MLNSLKYYHCKTDSVLATAIGFFNSYADSIRVTAKAHNPWEHATPIYLAYATVFSQIKLLLVSFNFEHDNYKVN